jgi:aryl-alcohol dehydrogenase-like predicted oxidoreductase
VIEERTLGSTGLVVTPIGVGLAALGRPAYINLGRDEDLGAERDVTAMERRCHEVLDAAYAAGVRYVDAARSYGFAEAFLASWFETRGLAADAVSVGSKWGYTYTGDWRRDAPVQEVKDHSLAALRRQVAESRLILGDRLNLYQIHSATLDSGILEDWDVLSELVGLRDQGLAVGLTLSGPRQGETLRRAMKVTVDGVNPFESVQATWNLLERSVGDALSAAHARGWGVIVKEAVGNGRLTVHNTSPQVEPLRRLARARGSSIDALAIAAVLANPWVDVALSGAVTVAQLRSNLGAMDVALSPEELDALAAMAEPADRYWSERSEQAWA